VVGADRRPPREKAVKLAIKIAAAAGGAFTFLALSGCGANAAGTGGTSEAGARACTAYGVHAIEHHITVTRKPAACQGLSKAEVNQALATAVLRVAGDAPKALRRKREAGAGAYLYHLVTAPPPVAAAAAGALRAVSGSSPRSGSKDLPMGVAALIAWLVTAASGAYVLGSWIARGGTLRRRPGSGGTGGTGSPPSVIFGHFGLALGGLASWATYLVTGWAALAWVSVGALLPVAGLGMATLAIGLPHGRRRAAGRSAPEEADLAGAAIKPSGGAAGGSATASDTPLDGGPSGSTRTAVVDAGGKSRDRTDTDASGRMPAKARLSPLVVAGHGVLAVTTMLLVLLATLGGVAS
jgi:hypothetical protein